MSITDTVQSDAMRKRSLNNGNILVYFSLIAICASFGLDYSLASESLGDRDKLFFFRGDFKGG